MECARKISLHSLYSDKMKITTANISLTNQCNFNCKHCSVNAGEKQKDELNFAELEDLFFELKEIGINNIELSGGEPMLRKELFKIVKYAKERGFYVKILTNGSLLSKEKINLLEELGLDEIAISLDGTKYDFYRLLRPVSRKIFRKILRNLRYLSKTKMYSKINMVLIDKNLDNLQEMIHLAEMYNLNELRVCYFSNVGRGKNLDYAIEPLKLIEEIKKLKVSRIKFFIGVPFARFNAGCLIKENVPLTIKSNGDVYPCPLNEKSLGNIRIERLVDIISKIKARSCLKGKYNGLNPICPLRKFELKELF